MLHQRNHAFGLLLNLAFIAKLSFLLIAVSLWALLHLFKRIENKFSLAKEEWHKGALLSLPSST